MIAFGRLYGVTRRDAYKRRARAQSLRPAAISKRRHVMADRRRTVRRRRG